MIEMHGVAAALTLFLVSAPELAFGQAMHGTPFGVPLQSTAQGLADLADKPSRVSAIKGPEQWVVQRQARQHASAEASKCYDFSQIPEFQFPNILQENVSALTACSSLDGVTVVATSFRNMSFDGVVRALSDSFRLTTRSFGHTSFSFEARGKSWYADVIFLPLGSVSSSTYCFLYPHN